MALRRVPMAKIAVKAFMVTNIWKIKVWMFRCELGAGEFSVIQSICLIMAFKL